VKELSATAGGTTQASIEQCFELLAAIDGYPNWHPTVITSAEVTERDADGLPTKARAVLHLANGFIQRDFRLNLAVGTQRPSSVEFARIPHDSGDQERLSVAWKLAQEGGQTRVEAALGANLSVPPFIPLGGVADSLAQGFLDAALKALSG
jgi:ribosome-associated toxin RatA of RatAB toxin-antitoxin module